MTIALALMLGAQVAGSVPVTVDPKRLAAEQAADADVVRSLRENGDVPSIARPVDVTFVGSAKAIELLAQDATKLGFSISQSGRMQDGSFALDLQRRQTTEPSAIRALTETALRIETRYGVRYDGWGTLAIKR